MSNVQATSSQRAIFELCNELEAIFLPNSRSKRDTLYNGRTQARFAHYTSADAALNIIRTKRIWMRNTTCMDDYREVQHGFEILKSFFDDAPLRTMFFEALDSCSPNIAKEALAVFDQWWGDIRYSSYIASVSEHDDKEDLHGRLSMWRAFGGNAARVAFVFNVPWFSENALELKAVFSPVAYLSKDDVHSEMKRVINNIREKCDSLKKVDRPFLIGYIVHMLIALVTCLKHEGFNEEREWRLLYSPKLTPSSLIEKETVTVTGVPQIVYKLPLDKSTSSSLADLDISTIFDRLIIGPSPYPWAMYEAFVEALKNAGIPDAESRVFTSGQ